MACPLFEVSAGSSTICIVTITAIRHCYSYVGFDLRALASRIWLIALTFSANIESLRLLRSASWLFRNGDMAEKHSRQVVIENPVLNSPFEEPERHWRFTDEGITDEVEEKRRISSYFVPIAKPRKTTKDKQLVFDTEWTKDRIKENAFINRVRSRVRAWR